MNKESGFKSWLNRITSKFLNADLHNKLLTYQLQMKKYKYASDTEDDEIYITIKNAKFGRWSA